MKMECTDCKYCASFDFGYRIICLHKDLPAQEVYEYSPLGDKNAENCVGFDEDEPQYFSMAKLIEAENSLSEHEEWENGIRRWCEAHR